MIKIILIAIVVIFSVLGLADFIHEVRLAYASNKSRGFVCSVIFLDKENPVKQMAYAAEQSLWHGKSYADFIIAVNPGIVGEDDDACKYIADKYDIKYCKAESLTEELKNYLYGQNNIE